MTKKARSKIKALKPSEAKDRKQGEEQVATSHRKRKKSISTVTRTIRDLSIYGVKPLQKPKKINSEKIKMTSSVEKGLLEKLKNYAYWEKITISEALNRLLKEGLKGGKTKTIPKFKLKEYSNL